MKDFRLLLALILSLGILTFSISGFSQDADVFLGFPLPNRDPYNAVINSVFDHSMQETYCPDSILRAYTGDEGRREFGITDGKEGRPDFRVLLKTAEECGTTNDPYLYGFKMSQGESSSVNGQAEWLYYDGHPGYDYRTRDQESLPGFEEPGRIPVLAAEAGIVRFADGDGGDYGEIYIQHDINDNPGIDYVSRYLHLDPASFNSNTAEVNDGQHVERGDVIGIAGDTGFPGSPHLHFEVRAGGRFGTPIDPYGWWNEDEEDPNPSNNFHLWDKLLVRPEEGTKVYWIQNGRKYWVMGPSVIEDMSGIPGWDMNKIYDLPEHIIDENISGPDFITDDTTNCPLPNHPCSNELLIRQENTPEVYKVKDGLLKHISPDECIETNCGQDTIVVTKDIVELFELQVLIAPEAGLPGTRFKVQFKRFTPNSTLTSHLQKPDGTELPTQQFTVNSEGNYTHTIDSTGFEPGTYKLWAVDESTGRESKPLSFEIITEEGHADVVLVIDRSPSMDKKNKLPAAKSVAEQFVGSLIRDGDMIGVVSFCAGSKVEYSLTPATSDTVIQEAIEAIRNISVCGATSIGAGLRKGQEELSLSGDLSYAHAMVLLSDGKENHDPMVSEVLPNIPEKTDVFTIAFGADADAGLLQNIASTTGGSFHFFKPDISGELHMIYNEIAGKVTGRTMIASQVGTVNQGQTTNITSTIDFTVPQVSFLLGWTGSDLGLTLEKPDGTTVDSSIAATDPQITYKAGSTFKTYQVTAPMNGQWTMQIEGVDIPSGGETFTASVLGTSTLSFNAYFDRDSYLAGQAITITTTLLEADLPILEATVNAEITDPKGDSTTITLFDDGLHNDEFADDGVYGNTYEETLEVGSYTFSFQADGETSTGESFTRITRQSVFVSEPTGSISGEILYEGKQGGTIYIQAWRDDSSMSENPDAQINIGEPGNYTLNNLPDGTYYLKAYRDPNDNQEPDRAEPQGVYGAPDPVIVMEGQPTKFIDIELLESPLIVIARYVEDCPQGAENASKVICKKEVEFASWLYLNNERVPDTGGQKMDLETLRQIISFYLAEIPIDEPPPEVSSEKIGAQLESLVGEKRAEAGLEVDWSQSGIFPNPVDSGTATLHIEGHFDKVTLMIFTLSYPARKVFEGTYHTNNADIDLADLDNGVYLYILIAEKVGEMKKSPVKKLLILK